LEWQCLKASCCFGQPKGPNLPFCYHGKVTTFTTTTSTPTSTQFVLTEAPPWPSTVTATTTTTGTGGSGLKGDNSGFTVLEASGIAGLGGLGFRIVPLLISAVAACLVGSMITVLLFGCGRCKGYRSSGPNSRAYSDSARSPDCQGPSGRDDFITGGSYQGLNLHSQYESLHSSPETVKGSWASSQVQNPI